MVDRTSGDVALITGGASGIGRTMALRLAERGSKVAILDINTQGLEETTALSPRIIPFICDVTDFDAVEEVIAEVETTIGPIESFVHCAAIMPGGALHDTPPEDINRVMQVNYCGTVNTTRAMLPYMRKRNRGNFIVLGSVAGVVPVTKFGAYGAAKAATNHYMKVLMRENEDTAINFQLVCPSTVDTPLLAQIETTGPEFLKKSLAQGTNMISPDGVVDSIEAGLKKNRRVNYPGVAQPLQILYRLFPRIVERALQRRS